MSIYRRALKEIPALDRLHDFWGLNRFEALRLMGKTQKHAPNGTVVIHCVTHDKPWADQLKEIPTDGSLIVGLGVTEGDPNPPPDRMLQLWARRITDRGVVLFGTVNAPVYYDRLWESL